MNTQHPVYTVETQCQDCYKCVRQCPVKAIRVSDGHARIIPELCIACGHCVQVCPAHAKRVRDDLGRARRLVGSGRPVYFSIAPSWVSEYPELDEAKLVTACKAIGVKGVSETALGAQQVSNALAVDLKNPDKGLQISSACPAAVEFVTKYLPAYRDCVTPVSSPLLAHAKLLRQEFGNDIYVIFVGPCVAKKFEADRNPELLQLALTFQDLRRWWDEDGVHYQNITPEADAKFVPDSAEEGALYPIAGGMIETMRLAGCGDKIDLLHLTGLNNIDNALDGFTPDMLEQPFFVEALACNGGCIDGPCMSKINSGLNAFMTVRHRAKMPKNPAPRKVTVDTNMNIPDAPTSSVLPNETQLREALAKVWKFEPADELNCGGCGYDTCRQFATAMLKGNAEPAMCVSYMRQRAQKKANALLRCIPSGAIIVDKDLKVIECNRPFAEMFGEETRLAFEAQPGLEGAVLQKILPFSDLFLAALKSGEDFVREHLPANGKLFNVTIFTVEPGQTVGAVMQDVTATELKREQIAKRAREVIRKNLSTVQEIACRLGEHMADTEILLSSIADDYAPDQPLEKNEDETE